MQAIAALRRLRLTGPEIAEVLSMPLSTVSGILTRIGMGKLGRLEPPESANRHERGHPGELIHLDVKKLGRIQGGAGHRVTGAQAHHVHARRQAPRSAGSMCMWRRRRHPAGLRRGAARREGHDRHRRSCAARSPSSPRTASPPQRLMTDNGSAYRSTVHALACRALGIRHMRTRPYRPRTNGKVCVLASRCRPGGRRGSPRPVV